MKGPFTLLLAAILHTLATPSAAHPRLKNILNINYEDDPHQFYLSHRTCFVAMVGLDWIEDALNKAIEQQVDSFTRNQKHRVGTKAGGHFEEKVKSASWSATYNKTAPSMLKYNESSIVVEKDLAVSSRQREVVLSFRARVALELGASKYGHQLRPRSRAEISEWSCKPSHFMMQSRIKLNSIELCDSLRQELEAFRLTQMLFQELLDYNNYSKHYTKFFNLDFAPQIIVGLFAFVEDFEVAIPSDKRVDFDLTKRRMDIMLNCNQQSVDIVRSYSSGNDSGEFQVSLMQNIIESALVDDWSMRVQDFEFLDEKIVWKIAQESDYKPELEERVSIVKNQAELEQYMDDPMQPHLRTRKRFAIHHHGDVMDRTALYQSLFFKIDEPSGTYGTTYFKVEGILDFIHVFKQGIGSRFGPSQELKSQRMSFTV